MATIREVNKSPTLLLESRQPILALRHTPASPVGSPPTMPRPPVPAARPQGAVRAAWASEPHSYSTPATAQPKQEPSHVPVTCVAPVVKPDISTSTVFRSDPPANQTISVPPAPAPPAGEEFIAVAAYSAEEATGLSFALGDVLRVLERPEINQGWWYAQLQGKTGWVPAPYLKPHVAEVSPKSSAATTSRPKPVVAARPKPAVPDKPKAVEPTKPASATAANYVAICAYQSEGGSNLSFPAGAILSVLERLDTGWWFAALNGLEGWVPSAYLKPAGN